MKVEFKYQGQSGIVHGLKTSSVALATNTLREATFFRGVLGRPTMFREALAALYDVVISDFKYHPKDRLAYRAWLEGQDREFLAGLAQKSDKNRAEIQRLEARRAELEKKHAARMKPFHAARHEYFNYVYENEWELENLFDPVITVHPDEVFFEAFSRDESSYARLGARYDLFEKIEAFECGTTNIDFSAKLHGELDRVRGYRQTRFDIDPSGFTVATEGSAAHREKKIDLPESWVKGFLQVHSTMAMGLTQIRIEPVDLFNLCRLIRRRKAHSSPRAMRWELTPGKRVKVVFEPWEHTLELTQSAVFDGPKALSIRTWGRDRLKTLARLLPLTQRIDVFLAGTGLPSIYVADLGEIKFTLGLSGWTDNDWTSGGTRFDLLNRRLMVSAVELTQTLESLRKTRYATDVGLSMDTGQGLDKTRSALSYLCQVGRCIFDLGGKVYRHRELFLEPFTVKEAQAVMKSQVEETTPEEKLARTLFEGGSVLLTARRPLSTGGHKLSGSVADKSGARVRPALGVDPGGRITEATCTCISFKNHGLTKGPCEHVLALRLAHMSRLEAENAKGSS